MEVPVASNQKLMAGDVVFHKGQEAIVVCGSDYHGNFCIDVPVFDNNELRLVKRDELIFKSHDPYDTFNDELTFASKNN
jgi:hypothetical protein